MDKKIEYLKNELQEFIEEKDKLEKSIHKDLLSIESIHNAIDHIKQSNDNTELPFYSSDRIPGFDGKEIDKLDHEKNEIQKHIDSNLIKKEKIETKIYKLQELLSDHKDIRYKDRLEVLNVQEVERQRIARDIHDTVVQNISALIYKNEFIMKIIDSDVERAKVELSVNNNILKDCINELRSIIFNLRPMSINDLDVKGSLNNIVSHIQDSTDMLMDYHISYDGTEVNSVIIISVIRIIQELCSNSMKHSKGTTMTLDIKISHEFIKINYADDGIGYNSKNLSSYNKDNTGFGIPILKDRVALLGGSFVIDSDIDKGVKYAIVIPICEEKNKCQ